MNHPVTRIRNSYFKMRGARFIASFFSFPFKQKVMADKDCERRFSPSLKASVLEEKYKEWKKAVKMVLK